MKTKSISATESSQDALNKYYSKTLKSFPDNFQKPFVLYTKRLFNLTDQVLKESINKNLKLVNKYFDQYDFKLLVLSDAIEKTFKNKINDDAYKNKDLILRSFLTYKDWLAAENKFAFSNSILFIVEQRSERIKELLKPFLASSTKLFSTVEKFKQGGGNKNNLALYYAIIKTSKEKKPTINFISTIRSVIKNKKQFEDINRGKDIFQFSRDEFESYCKAKHNIDVNSDEQFIQFLYGSLQESRQEKSLYKNLDKFYSRRLAKEHTKVKILNSILKELSNNPIKK